jgi:hypothetical protein
MDIGVAGNQRFAVSSAVSADKTIARLEQD